MGRRHGHELTKVLSKGGRWLDLRLGMGDRSPIRNRDGGEVDMFQVVRSCRRAVSAESDERTAATCHTDPTVGPDAARLPRLRRQNVVR